jgi:hypothetical protein
MNEYSKTEAIDAGKRFKSPSGLMVETTGKSFLVDSNNLYVHEVQIVEGTGQGSRYLLNLDVAEPA